MKLLGCILVAGSALFLGLRAGRELLARVRGLDEVAQALLLLEQELEFSAPDLPELAEKLSRRGRGAGAALFARFGENLSRLGEDSVGVLWEQAVGDLPLLSGEAKELLRPLGESLGRYDAQSQCRDIALLRLRLEQLRRREEEVCREKSRLCRVLSLSGGVFLVILLI